MIFRTPKSFFLLHFQNAAACQVENRASWSPDGRFVAFSTQITGRFQIATIGLRDRGVKQHTVDGGNEDPSWAPDARHVVFTSTRTGSKQLWVLDTESGRLRQLTHGGGASRMAAWSPRFFAAR